MKGGRGVQSVSYHYSRYLVKVSINKEIQGLVSA